MRILFAAVVAYMAPAAAQAACTQVPLAETPKTLLKAFSERMEKAGAGDWRFATETPRGLMFYSNATQMRLVIKGTDGLTEEAGLLLPPEGTAADAARMEAAASFLGAHISGAPEASFGPRVVKAIADTKKDRQPHQVREGETTLMFSSPAPGAVALVSGRLRCE